MFACKTITLPKSIPLLERISKANKQISEWHQSLERQFDLQTDMLRLARYEENGREYGYEYEIVRRRK
jgi:hypothetical protein